MQRIIIAGAGPAGLTAAYTLLKENRDFDVLILEETDTVGGISRTVNHNGNRMDIGGHRFFSKNEAIVNIWKELLKDDLLVRNRVSRIYYKHRFFDYPISLSASLFINLGFSDTVAAGFSYLKSLVHKLPETNLENFYINRFGKKLYSMFFEGYTEKLWGVHPRELDASWGAQRVKGVSVKEVLKNAVFKKSKETSLIDKFYYPKYGPGQMWETMAAEIIKMGGKILFNKKIDGITVQDGIISEIMCDDSSAYSCDYFISSMPIKDLCEAGGFFNFNSRQMIVTELLPYRDFITAGLLINKKYVLKDKKTGKLIPDCWIYIQDPGLKIGRVQIFNNWSENLVCDEDYVWIGAEFFDKEGSKLWNLDERKFADYALNQLKEAGIVSEDAVLSDYHREYQKKAYPAYFGTYEEFDSVKESLNKIKNLYCIGRNGQHRYNNMDHSMLTGIKAAELILTGNEDKTELWKINTDKEFHEEKSK